MGSLMKTRRPSCRNGTQNCGCMAIARSSLEVCERSCCHDCSSAIRASSGTEMLAASRSSSAACTTREEEHLWSTARQGSSSSTAQHSWDLQLQARCILLNLELQEGRADQILGVGVLHPQHVQEHRVRHYENTMTWVRSQVSHAYIVSTRRAVVSRW